MFPFYMDAHPLRFYKVSGRSQYFPYFAAKGDWASGRIMSGLLRQGAVEATSATGNLHA